MGKPVSDDSTVFLLGAGFNVDATSEAGYPYGCKYPLVNDLLETCFGINELPPGKSVEDLFQESINNKENKPIQSLCDCIEKADYFISEYLINKSNPIKSNYVDFLQFFPTSHILTFNYDSLIEILLYNEDTWVPNDGYGVSVECDLRTYRFGEVRDNRSHRFVLHLHGSMCVYTAIFSAIQRSKDPYSMLEVNEPRFVFEPRHLGKLFPDHTGKKDVHNYNHGYERVVPPTPNKAEGMEDPFIQDVYKHEEELLRNARQLISIGYSFNPHDQSSYKRLFNAFAENSSNKEKSMLIISPDIGTIKKNIKEAESIKEDLEKILMTYEEMPFKEWVETGYPGSMQTAVQEQVG